MNTEKYKDYSAALNEQSQRAAIVQSVLIDGAMNDGKSIEDRQERAVSMIAAADGYQMFEGLSAQEQGTVLSAWNHSLEEYVNTYGELPSDELMSNALMSSQKVAGSVDGGQMFESVNESLQTSEGVPIRARTIAIILPTLLSSATSDLVTYIPADANESEIFEIQHEAANTFGDRKKGEKIDGMSFKQYTSMSQFHPIPDAKKPDGTLKKFSLNVKNDLGVNASLRSEGTIKIFVNSKPVAKQSSDNPNAFSPIENTAEVTVDTAESAIDHAAGIITIAFINAPKAGTNLTFQFEYDLEQNPDILPEIVNKASSVKLKPHWCAIGASATVQSYWTTERELGYDQRSNLHQQQRNLIADDKDRTNLALAIFAAHAHTIKNWSVSAPDGITESEHMKTLARFFGDLGTDILNTTKKSGVKGAYFGKRAIHFIMQLPSQYFEKAPNYQEAPRIQYVGKLFGMYKIYRVPHELDFAGIKFGEMSVLAYGRGESFSEAGIVNGDAIPPTFIPQSIANKFKQSTAMLTLRYQDLHPKGGENYFRMFEFTESAPVQG